MQAVIISGGWMEEEFVLDFLKHNRYDRLIAVDSGMDFFYRNHLVPDIIVGDFDSVKQEVLAYFREEHPSIPVFHFQPEKDETDTELAIRTAIEAGCSGIYLLGATGSRMDHVLGNIHLLGMAMEQGCDCQIIDAYNRIRMLSEGITLNRQEQYGDYVSLIPFTPSVKGLTLTGFKYPLCSYELKCYHSLGVSNEILEEEAEISFAEGVVLLIESRDKKQKKE